MGAAHVREASSVTFRGHSCATAPSYPHSLESLSFVRASRENGGMTAHPQEVDADAGDPTRRQLDAVRRRGPLALAELLGDQAFLLAELATVPGTLFAALGEGTGEGGERMPDHFSAVIGRLHEQRAALEALEVRAVVGLAEATRRQMHAAAQAEAAQEAESAAPAPELDQRAERAAAREFSMITRRSPSGAGRTLGACTRMVESMPEMLRALATGQVDAENIHSAAASLAPLSPGQREQVDRGLAQRLPALDGAGRKRWKREVAAQIEAADPRGELRRHQHARTRRHVTMRPGEHGMATISAHLSALDAAKIRKRLSLEAERLRAQGDRRGHEAIQADTFADTLLGRSDGMDPTRLDIGVILTDRALLTPSRGDIARIEGYGPVSSESLREELRSVLSSKRQEMDAALGADGPAARAALRRLYTHPTTGELVAMESVGRAFPPALARFILWRDVTCRGPFCDAPIRQTDHITPHAAGGRTCSDNGEGVCAHCNDKEQQTRTVQRDDAPENPGHRVTWTSRSGITRTTTADPLGPATPPGSMALPGPAALPGPVAPPGSAAPLGPAALLGSAAPLGPAGLPRSIDPAASAGPTDPAGPGGSIRSAGAFDGGQRAARRSGPRRSQERRAATVRRRTPPRRAPSRRAPSRRAARRRADGGRRSSEGDGEDA